MLPVRKSSSWNAEQISQYLDLTEQPLRLALMSSGAPLIVPLWFVFDDGVFWCASPDHAKLVQLVAEQAQCGFDVSDNTMPYKGVRGQADARLVPEQGEAILHTLVQRYLKKDDSEFAQWLLSRKDDEVAIAVTPRWITAWDFSARMAAR